MSDDDLQNWTINHFSQSNPSGPGQDDVPALLRRIADSIESRRTRRVVDVVFHRDETTEAGEWPSMTVYFHPSDRE